MKQSEKGHFRPSCSLVPIGTEVLRNYYIFFNYSLMLAVLKVDLGEEAEPCWFVASTHTLSSLWLDTSIGEI